MPATQIPFNVSNVQNTGEAEKLYTQKLIENVLVLRMQVLSQPEPIRKKKPKKARIRR